MTLAVPINNCAIMRSVEELRLDDGDASSVIRIVMLDDGSFGYASEETSIDAELAALIDASREHIQNGGRTYTLEETWSILGIE